MCRFAACRFDFFFNCQFISQNVSIRLAKKGPFHKRLYIYYYVIDAKQTQTDTYLISNTLKPPDVSAANELKNTLKIDVILMFCIGFCARRFFFWERMRKYWDCVSLCVCARDDFDTYVNDFVVEDAKRKEKEL